MTATKDNRPTPVFEPINAENDNGVTEIESLCMNCHEQGITRLLLTRIPFFRDVIISSFSCEHCNFSNNEIQSANAIQDLGCTYTLKVDPKKDLNRQIVKTDATVIKIPELDFEIPPKSQKGSLTTIEGVITRAADGLEQYQPVRKITEPAVAEKIENFLVKLKSLLNREEPFVFVVDDPTGNCFVENLFAPDKDPNLELKTYKRSNSQDEDIGIFPAEDKDESHTEEVSNDEVLEFKVNCPGCNAPISTRMKTVNIPHFKEVIIMATTCDACGFKSNEVKSGSGFEVLGKKFTLSITDPTDLSRDVLKSETCSVEIPELELEVGQYCVSGKFTTVEGLITDIRDMVKSKNSFLCGDSATGEMKEKFNQFNNKITELLSGNIKFTLILDDPVGNSYLQNVYAPDEDPEMKVEQYERTFEQNEDLGLNDMKV